MLYRNYSDRMRRSLEWQVLCSWPFELAGIHEHCPVHDRFLISFHPVYLHDAFYQDGCRYCQRCLPSGYTHFSPLASGSWKPRLKNNFFPSAVDKWITLPFPEVLHVLFMKSTSFGYPFIALIILFYPTHILHDNCIPFCCFTVYRYIYPCI